MRFEEVNSARCLTLLHRPCVAPAQLSIMPGRERRKPGEQAAEVIGHVVFNSQAHITHLIMCFAHIDCWNNKLFMQHHRRRFGVWT